MIIRAVLFDVGGVIETEGPMPAHLEAAFALVDDPDDLITTGHRSEEWIRRSLREAGLSVAVVDSLMADMWDWYCGSLDQGLFDWAVGLRRRVRTAILSNSADGARREEESRYRLSTVFDPIVYSHEVGLKKPDPRIFALTCELLDLEPGEIVFIDNLPDNVAAAEDFGLHALLHTETGATIRAVEGLLGSRVQP